MSTKWNRLILHIDGYLSWPVSSLKFLSTLIDLPQSNEIWLVIIGRETFASNIINSLFEQASNVRTLGISHNNDLTSIIDDICSVVSHRIDHLKIRLNYINYMKLILERIEHVSTITFIHDWRLLSHQTKMIEWLNEKQRKFSIANDYQSLQAWLNKDSTESSEIEMKN
jgi:hypothetical protein